MVHRCKNRYRRVYTGIRMCRTVHGGKVSAKWCIKEHEGGKWYMEKKIGTEWCIKAHMRTDGPKNKHRDKERYRRVYHAGTQGSNQRFRYRTVTNDRS